MKTAEEYKEYADEYGVSLEAYKLLFENHKHFEDDENTYVDFYYAIEAIKKDREQYAKQEAIEFYQYMLNNEDRLTGMFYTQEKCSYSQFCYDQFKNKEK